MSECHILPPTGEGTTYGTLSVSANNRADKTRITIEVTLPLPHAVRSGHLQLAAARGYAEIVDVDNDAKTFKIRFNDEEQLRLLLAERLNHLLTALTEQAYARLIEDDDYSKVCASHYLAPGAAQEFLTAFVLFDHGYVPTEEKA